MTQRSVLVFEAVVDITRRKVKRRAVVMDLRLLAIIAARPKSLSFIQGRHAAVRITEQPATGGDCDPQGSPLVGRFGDGQSVA